ncbi:hypothetical protein CC2G_014226 [Coprinopsis cinerea AmutBmut pab1-1]|nr:hypothetical protein CC2G_014226 [Coprinopsis cinerea AmutBmut pab1-1]
MPMPKKYHSVEERQAAARRNSQRYHQKNKESINLKKRTSYRERNPKRLERQLEELRNADERRAQEARDPQFWLDRARKLPERLRKVVGEQPAQFFEELCHRFLSHSAGLRDIEDIVSQLHGLQKVVSNYERHVLDLAGCGAEYSEITTLSTLIKTAVQAAEELEILAKSEEDMLQEQLTAKSLIFQTM